MVDTLFGIGIVTVAFEPERVDYVAPEAGGAVGAMTAGFPRWTLRLTYTDMRDDDADGLRAWVAMRRGAQRPFVAWDVSREGPRRHLGGRPYNPTPTGWSQAIGGDGIARLTLTGLLPGQTVSIGDYVGFGWSVLGMELARACERAIAGADGVSTFAIEPPLPPVVPANAAVTLRRAGCLMRLVPGETKLAEQGLAGFGSGSTIVAVQDLIR